MDKVERYREIVKKVLTPIVERHYTSRVVENEAVFDEKNDRYLVMQVGWQGRIKRIHGCLAHLDIIGGKIWIQSDGTEDGIAYDLEAEGVPKEDIVPAFYSIEAPPHMGYAVT